MKRLQALCMMVVLIMSSVVSTWSQEAKTVSMPVKSSSQDAITTFHQGLEFFDLGDSKKAREYFMKSVQQDPKLSIGHAYLAVTSITPKEFMEHLKNAETNLATASEWEKLQYKIFETYTTANMEQRAKAAQEMVEKFPNSARAQVELANTYGDALKNDKAREHFQKAISLEPNWIGGYNALAYSYLFSEPKDFSLAEQNANKVIALYPGYRNGYTLLGNSYKAQNKLEQAKIAFTKAIELAPTIENSYYDRGSTNSLMGNYEEARQDYMEAAKYDEMPSTALEKIAISYLFQEEPQKALQFLKTEADKINIPGDAEKTSTAKFFLLYPTLTIAFHLEDSKNYSDAVKKMMPLSEQYFANLGTDEAKNFNNAMSFYYKASIQTLEGDYAGAMSNAGEMKKLLETIKDDRFVEMYHFLAGQIDLRKKDYEKAIDHFMKTNKNSTYDQYWLAKAYEGAGQQDKAMQIYKNIADYNFDDIGYALIRKEVKQKNN